jgi:conjugative relaxase-like TrwC/TraI family protein
MGVDAVAYHKETVVERGDDHPGRALDYYGTRGETPLRWGGAMAARLGLVGEVTEAQYEAAFGPGGFRDPLTGERLVSTKTPGVEIVVAVHKTTAMLGVIGRADDMHAILDAETNGLMGWLETSMQESGGRRGRAATVTPTTGLAYAVTRHGTSRAGDPSAHDHVLIPNVTEMLDTKGGYKALYTALLRDRVEAATMVGRLHSAHLAVKLGYAIEPDNGPSGRLRHWRIAGIPSDVCEKLSKRSDEIAAYLAEQGFTSYQAANIAARATRSVKRHTGVDELLDRWHAEIAEAGWPVERIAAALDAARQQATGVAAPLTADEIEEITARLMDPEGPFLARGKVFSRSRLISEVALLLYGHEPAELDDVLDHILASGLVTPLIGVASAVEQPYTATAVLTTEQTIAETVERLVDAPGPTLDPAAVRAAIAAKEDEIGAALAAGQYQAINAVCCSGRAVDVIVGIAGSGKTTALDAAATALEQAGYRVIGTATSGQAARTLADAAGIEARTTRSLLWQLDHGGIVLDHTSVVVLDEAGMTTDVDMARLVLAVEAAGAKVVIVGDDRQLSAVGPCGALHQVLADHPQVVTTLTENRRQRDPGERDALLELRAGDLDQALAFYAENDRITIEPQRTQLLFNLVADWAADTAAGHDTFMLAWRRQSVADLNRIAPSHRPRRGLADRPRHDHPHRPVLRGRRHRGHPRPQLPGPARHQRTRHHHPRRPDGPGPHDPHPHRPVGRPGR